MNAFVEHFSDPQAVARYAEGPPRFVPGYHHLHRMAAILMAERAPANGSVLVLGAGGGLELKAFAEAQPQWTFLGVDPAPAMLKLAEATLDDHAPRATLVEGYIDDAPGGPFDAAACLLTMHFMAREERRRTAAEIRRRLKPGAPLVVAHSSFPQAEGERDLWLSRYAAFAAASGVEPDKAQAAREVVASTIDLLDPGDDEAVLREAGFSDVSLFFAAFTWRGWVAYA